MRIALSVAVWYQVFTGLAYPATAPDGLQRVTVCLRNPGAVHRETLISTEQTLWRSEKRIGAVIRMSYGDCSDSQALVVTFVDHPSPPHPADALGATRTARDTILPDTQLFFRAAAAMLRNPTEENQGRALGAIIAHELYHYLKQTRRHDGSDLNCAFLTESQLLATR